MMMMNRKHLVIIGVLCVLLLGLTACVSENGGGISNGEKKDTQAAPAQAAQAPITTDGVVLAQKEIDAPSAGSSEAPGGTLLVTVRSVLVTKDVTVVSWAMRWDNPKEPDNTAVTMNKFLGTSVHPPVLTDGAALKIYYPLGRNWHNNGPSLTDPQTLCSPRNMYVDSTLANHQTFEAWALFPGLGATTQTVDLALPDGLPAFPGLPVTRS